MLQAIYLERARLESTNACGNEDGFCQKLRAFAGFDVKAAVGLSFDHGYFLAQVVGGAKRIGLLEQGVCQLFARADGDGGNVVNGLVWKQLDRLAARVGQRVDDVGFDFQQAQLKNLEQTNGAGTDDDGISFNGFGKITFCGGHGKQEISWWQKCRAMKAERSMVGDGCQSLPIALKKKSAVFVASKKQRQTG